MVGNKQECMMSQFPIPVCALPLRRRFQRRGPPRQRNPSNLCYPPLTPCENFTVTGGLWNCQSATRKADFISAYASLQSLQFLALTETWITPDNSATPAALSSSYSFSHTPRRSGRGGGTGLLISPTWKFSVLPLPDLSISTFEFHPVSITYPANLYIIVIYRPPGPLGSFLDELDTLLSSFPEDGTPLILLGDFNIHLEASQSAAFLPLLHSFDLSLQHSPPTHKAGNLLDLIFLRTCSSSNLTVTPLHTSDHHFISFSFPLVDSCQLTLDPDTAHEKLRLSEEDRKVTYGKNIQTEPEHNEDSDDGKFDHKIQVLCGQSLLGCCYWEAEWSGDRVCMGVSYAGITRKGGNKKCRLGNNDKSWSLRLSNPNHYLWHNDKQEGKINALNYSKIGVYLDYEAGTLSFYSISDTMTLLGSFEAKFTHPLYAAFGFSSYGSTVKLCDPNEEDSEGKISSKEGETNATENALNETMK